MVRSRYTADWALASLNTDDGLSIVIPTAGVAEATVDTRTVTVPPLTALLAPCALLHHYEMCCVGGTHASVALMFDATTVSKVLSEMFNGATLRKLDLAPLLDLSAGAGASFNLLGQTIVSGMYGARVFERSPKAMALLIEAALRIIFEHVPHRFSYRLNRQVLGATPRHVLRAIDFMHANMHNSLTMADIAETVGVSVRSLQAAFRQFRDTTPAAHLRRIRLEAIHAELSLPENRLPVSEVALKWGFAHMGRFAAQYREMFGAYPSETVRRAHGPHMLFSAR